MTRTPITRLLWYLSSLLLLLACCWFAIMEFVRRNDGFEMRALIALLIAFFSLLCLRYAFSNPFAGLRRILVVFATVTLAISILVMRADLRSAHFEGYIFLISLLLITQSVLTFVNVLTRPRPHLA
jgi:hypothetical protein